MNRIIKKLSSIASTSSTTSVQRYFFCQTQTYHIFSSINFYSLDGKPLGEDIYDIITSKCEKPYLQALNED